MNHVHQNTIHEIVIDMNHVHQNTIHEIVIDMKPAFEDPYFEKSFLFRLVPSCSQLNVCTRNTINFISLMR